jgi:hypothetical protein
VLKSVGAELAVDAGFFGFVGTRIRVGAAQPLTGTPKNIKAYLTFGSAF